MEKSFNFVFITTNLINGKQYVGDHSSNDLNCSYTKNYLGSGRPYFSDAKQKYGKSNFVREIIEFFPTKQEAFDSQEKYIKLYNTLVPNGYNISPKGGHNVKGCISEETKKKLSKSLKGKQSAFKGKHHSNESKKLLRDVHLNKPLSEKHKQKIAIGNTGKNHTQETKDKIRNGNIGVFPSEESRKLMSISQQCNKNCVGRIISEETRRKISKSRSGIAPWNKGLHK